MNVQSRTLKAMAAAFMVGTASMMPLSGMADEFNHRASVQQQMHPAERVIKDSTDAFIGALRRNPSSLYQSLDRHILDNFDFYSLTASALGPDWRSATAGQRKKLVAGFTEMLVRTYGKQAAKFDEVTIDYDGARIIRNGSMKKVEVSTELTKKNGVEISLDYFMYKRGNGPWKVYDLKFEGFSLALKFRREFGNVIDTQGGINGLIGYLEAENKKSAPTGLRFNP